MLILKCLYIFFTLCLIIIGIILALNLSLNIDLNTLGFCFVIYALYDLSKDMISFLKKGFKND